MVRGQRKPTPRKRTGRSTIRDVAAAAGVSTATVSYVLNDVPNQTITAATQERVRAAATTLGYRSLLTADPADASTSAVVFLNVGTDAIGASLSRVIRTMRGELRRHNRALVVTTERSGDSRLLRSSLAPLAVVDFTRLLIDARDDGLWGVFRGHQVGFSFHSKMQLQHVAAYGHRRVALAIPEKGTGVFGRARVAHARRAAHELGMPPLTVVRVPMDPDPRRRMEAIRALVEESGVTAVAALDDEVALTVLAVMARLGYRAPEDLAVIGFNDEHKGHLWEPSLTTVRIDTAAYGRRAARLAVDLAAPDWIEAPCKIINRATV